MTTLQRRGFEAGQAGALTEIERLLERHVQDVFEAAVDYADLAHRSNPNAIDLLLAYEEGSHSLRKLRKQAKKRRRGHTTLRTIDEPEETLSELRGFMGTDERELDYAYEGAPSLPGRWTYAQSDSLNPDEGRKEIPVKATTATLDFVKSTATERGDISPELGLVYYRRMEGTGKRKWGVKGVGRTPREGFT